MIITTHSAAPVSGAIVEALKVKLVAEVKAAAGRRILNLIPDWKQRNATARAVEIINARMNGTATAADLAELAAIAEIYEMVKAIRRASDEIEADIRAGLITSFAQIKSSGRWPTI